MMNGVSRALLVTAVLLPVLGEAQESATTRPASSQFNYTYVELGYDETEYQAGNTDVDGDGLTLSGSFEINDDWHAFASYGTADLDFGIDLDTFVIGAGYAFPLRQDVDLYGRVLYLNLDADVGALGADEDGLGLQFRIRALVTDELELEGGVQYVDIEDSDTSLQVGARYYFTETFSAGIGLTIAGDTDGIGINARYSF
jgi:Outer membrane protein beta-barrel domain